MPDVLFHLYGEDLIDVTNAQVFAVIAAGPKLRFQLDQRGSDSDPADADNFCLRATHGHSTSIQRQMRDSWAHEAANADSVLPYMAHATYSEYTDSSSDWVRLV